jgi:hypothetical protein
VVGSYEHSYDSSSSSSSINGKNYLIRWAAAGFSRRTLPRWVANR